MKPQLESLEQRYAPSNITAVDFAASYAASYGQIIKQEEAILAALPATDRNQAAQAFNNLNSLVGTIPNAVVPLFVAGGGSADQQAVADAVMVDVNNVILPGIGLPQSF